MKGRVSVVIVAFRSSRTIRACLEPLVADPDVGSIRVLDNSNEVDCMNIVQEFMQRTGRVEYVPMDRNVGFGAACNHGASLDPELPIIAFINPDVELTMPLDPLVSRLEGEGYSMASGSLGATRFGTPANARREATLWREFGKAILGSEGYLYRTWHGNVGHPAQIDGAFILITRDLFERIGRFDERFELYYEDVDLCNRARARGPIFLTSDLWGTHEGGASFKESPGGRAFVALRISRARYLRKRSSRPRATTFALGLLAGVEFVSRSIARTPEGQAVRWTGFRHQIDELREPGSVKVLASP